MQFAQSYDVGFLEYGFLSRFLQVPELICRFATEQNCIQHRAEYQPSRKNFKGVFNSKRNKTL